MNSEISNARARLAMESRRGGDPEKAKAARADLAAAKLSQYITRIVAEAPPMSDETLDRIALLLRPAPVKPQAAARIKRVRGVVRNSGGGESE